LPTTQEARYLFDAGISGSTAFSIGINNWWIWISGTCTNEDIAKNSSFYNGVSARTTRTYTTQSEP
jgi:hypothetical protein